MNTCPHAFAGDLDAKPCSAKRDQARSALSPLGLNCSPSAPNHFPPERLSWATHMLPFAPKLSSSLSRPARWRHASKAAGFTIIEVAMATFAMAFAVTTFLPFACRDLRTLRSRARRLHCDQPNAAPMQRRGPQVTR